MCLFRSFMKQITLLHQLNSNNKTVKITSKNYGYNNETDFLFDKNDIILI
jgi:hypothetical protein